VLDRRLAAAGVTPQQVETAWVKLANANPTQPYPTHADVLRDNIITVLQNAEARYPNLRLAYLSSRIYGGYATSNLNPEPYAYESAFAVRNVVTAQISGDARLRFDGAHPSSPWIAWGPYLWADGLRPRSDGLTWSCSDFQASDGTHPSDSGRRKVADMLLRFVKSDATAHEWFVR
jgi:lysophospholipase L1-like esterase